MRPLLLAAVLMAALPALAGDAVDGALADLGADDAQRREAAGTLLWNAGPEALERAKKVLAETTDAEVRARLGPIVEWLTVQAKCLPLEAAWKDRWFLIREDGEIVGVEHQQAVLEVAAGERVWKFVHETDAVMRGSTPERIRLVVRARQDLHLTPLDAELEAKSQNGAVRIRYRWKDGEISVEVLENSVGGNDFHRRSYPAQPLEREDDGPFTVDALLAERIERASLAGLDRVQFAVNRFMETDRDGVKCTLYQARFDGVEAVEAGGRRLQARRYVHEAEAGMSAATYWVADGEGLVKAVIDRLELTKCDEAAARAAGLDPASMRLKEARARVDALVAGGAGAARDEAELAVLASPEALAPVREALKADTDGDLRTRLERCERWLDPEIAREDLARLLAERYFEIRMDDAVVGAERFGASPVEIGGRPALAWSGESSLKSDGGRPYSTWTARTLRDPAFTPLDAEYKTVDEKSIAARWRVEVTEGNPTVSVIAGTPPNEMDGSMRPSVLEPALPPTFDGCLPILVERASLCRLPAVRLRAWWPGSESRRITRSFLLVFRDEARLEVAGESRVVRRYEAQGMHPGQFWVSDAGGIVKMTRDDATLVSIPRDAWLASGLDSASIERRTLEKRLAALRGSDPVASNAALVSLLAVPPDQLPAIREAIAAEKDEACRARLESVCRWHDPAFGKEDLAKLGRTRWYAKSMNGARAGWERVGATVDADGKWTFSVASSGSAGPMRAGDFEGTFTSPDFGLSGSYETEISMTSGTSRVRLAASFRGVQVTLKRIVIDGVDVQPPDGTKPLRGEARGPIVSNALVPLLLERASLARLDAVELTTWDLMGSSRLTVKLFEMKGEESVTVGGAAVAARKYVLARSAEAETYWITDAGGVVKLDRAGTEGEAATEEEAKKEDDK